LFQEKSGHFQGSGAYKFPNGVVDKVNVLNGAYKFPNGIVDQVNVLNILAF